MQSELSIDVDRPREAVFSAVLEDVSAWSLTCVEDEILEDKNDGGAGTTFRILTEDRGRKMEFTGEVTRHEPPALSSCYMTGKAFDIDVSYRFEEIESGTRVTQVSEVTPKGFMKVMFVLVGWMAKKGACDAQRLELESLKRYAEEHIPA